MLHMITSEAVVAEDALGMIYGGTVDSTQTWVETSAMLVTVCKGKPFGTYFILVLTDAVTAEDLVELQRLEVELGKKLDDCVVERERYDKPHRFFPGSRSFQLVTLYAG
ncbi:hypothetical protein ABZ353_10770 [Streptomyces niveus]|uniref:hypothetical protein n=1 Tax=Streptomyces niveus TaxID=193462 RepID=UPI0033C5F6B6